MKLQEQVCRKHGKRPYTYETWLKKQTVRAERRQARREPESLPTYRRFRGYSD